MIPSRCSLRNAKELAQGHLPVLPWQWALGADWPRAMPGLCVAFGASGRPDKSGTGFGDPALAP